MNLREQVPLATLSTLKVGGAARYVVECETSEAVREAVVFAKEHHLPFYVLGEGSNVLPSDAGYSGVVILMRIPGITYEEDEGGVVRMTCGAGVPWDVAVQAAAEKGLWGIENLAGIPGTCGAAPVQNIGAYGAELVQVFLSAEVFDAAADAVRTVMAEDCAFAYRDSRFKHDPNLLILSVTFRLSKEGTPRIEYGDLLRARDEGVDLSTPLAIGAAVRAIRSRKFPDLTRYGTAGSFFKNPILTEEAYQALTARYGSIPKFPNPHGIKIPLAFVLDRVLGLRDFRLGNAFLYGAQPLVLTLEQGAGATDAERLATEVEQKVKKETGISIEREVRTMPPH